MSSPISFNNIFSLIKGFIINFIFTREFNFIQIFECDRPLRGVNGLHFRVKIILRVSVIMTNLWGYFIIIQIFIRIFSMNMLEHFISFFFIFLFLIIFTIIYKGFGQSWFIMAYLKRFNFQFKFIFSFNFNLIYFSIIKMSNFLKFIFGLGKFFLEINS